MYCALVFLVNRLLFNFMKMWSSLDILSDVGNFGAEAEVFSLIRKGPMWRQIVRFWFLTSQSDRRKGLRD